MKGDEERVQQEPDKTTVISHGGRKKSDTIHLKILVPSGAVGAIIGKGGESIAQVQDETGARIKLSKLNDFYPGTTERVCLIHGTVDAVTKMHNYIMDRMLEKPDCAGQVAVATSGGGGSSSSSSPGARPEQVTWMPPGGSRLPWGRHQQVKILVPNCTAGLVIGKLGSYVKEIKDRTGAFIQISQKSKEINLPERCITIAGERDQRRAAVALVLQKIAEDPQSTSCPTISYARVQGPVASAYPTGSPFAALPRFPQQPPPPAQQQPLDVFQVALMLAARAYYAPTEAREDLGLYEPWTQQPQQQHPQQASYDPYSPPFSFVPAFYSPETTPQQPQGPPASEVFGVLPGAALEPGYRFAPPSCAAAQLPDLFESLRLTSPDLVPHPYSGLLLTPTHSQIAPPVLLGDCPQQASVEEAAAKVTVANGRQPASTVSTAVPQTTPNGVNP